MSTEKSKHPKRGPSKYPSRIPIPIKPEKPHSTKKGETGYSRKKQHTRQKDLIHDDLGFSIENEG